MSRLTSKLRNRVEVLTRQKFENVLGENEYRYSHSKYVYMQILSKNSKMVDGEADTEKVESTHMFKCRIKSISNLDNTYRFKYKNQIYEVKYFDPDFKNNEFYEIYTRLVVE